MLLDPTSTPARLINNLNNCGESNLPGNWMATGVDIFEGPATGLFGAFDDKDRVYTEARYSF